MLRTEEPLNRSFRHIEDFRDFSNRKVDVVVQHHNGALLVRKLPDLATEVQRCVGICAVPPRIIQDGVAADLRPQGSCLPDRDGD